MVKGRSGPFAFFIMAIASHRNWPEGGGCINLACPPWFCGHSIVWMPPYISVWRRISFHLWLMIFAIHSNMSGSPIVWVPPCFESEVDYPFHLWLLMFAMHDYQYVQSLLTQPTILTKVCSLVKIRQRSWQGWLGCENNAKEDNGLRDDGQVQDPALDHYRLAVGTQKEKILLPFLFKALHWRFALVQYCLVRDYAKYFGCME